MSTRSASPRTHAGCPRVHTPLSAIVNRPCITSSLGAQMRLAGDRDDVVTIAAGAQQYGGALLRDDAARTLSYPTRRTSAQRRRLPAIETASPSPAPYPGPPRRAARTRAAGCTARQARGAPCPAGAGSAGRPGAPARTEPTRARPRAAGGAASVGRRGTRSPRRTRRMPQAGYRTRRRPPVRRRRWPRKRGTPERARLRRPEPATGWRAASGGVRRPW